MNIEEYAKKFAINAHKGQVRKGEPDKPMIIHPIGVGLLLKEYGYDSNLIAAAYLHDVVEDTKYTIEDIKKIFGDDIAILVDSATEPNKKDSWEKRKQFTIYRTKYLPLRNKLLLCADKINNLEDIMLKFQKEGKRDFSAFNRGEKKQQWYYENIYKSLIYNEDKNLEIFKRLKKVIDIVFHEEDNEIKNTIFKDNIEYYDKLKKLHAQKIELQKLKALCSLPKPYTIEFLGTPRTGKTTIIDSLYDFFYKGNFDISLIEDFSASNYYKTYLNNIINNMSPEESNKYITKIIYYKLLKENSSSKDILLLDRSINDRQIWNYIQFKNKIFSKESYLKLKNYYLNESKELIDHLIITYAPPLTSLQREYNKYISLEERSFLNEQNIKEYNDSLIELKELFKESANNITYINTDNNTINNTTIEIANSIMPKIRKKYIESFNKKYNIK